MLFNKKQRTKNGEENRGESSPTNKKSITKIYKMNPNVKIQAILEEKKRVEKELESAKKQNKMFKNQLEGNEKGIEESVPEERKSKDKKGKKV